MNKSWILIGLGSLIIVGVMVFLTIKGVSRREHTFIKWSQIQSPERMGRVTMERLFPLLKEHKNVTVFGDTRLSPDFISGFSAGVEKNQIPITVEPGQAGNPENISILLKQLVTDKKPGSCADKTRDECIFIKAQRKWHKKKRDPSQYWFILQWVDTNQFHLYFTPPQTSP